MAASSSTTHYESINRNFTRKLSYLVVDLEHLKESHVTLSAEVSDKVDTMEGYINQLEVYRVEMERVLTNNLLLNNKYDAIIRLLSNQNSKVDDEEQKRAFQEEFTRIIRRLDAIQNNGPPVIEKEMDQLRAQFLEERGKLNNLNAALEEERRMHEEEVNNLMSTLAEERKTHEEQMHRMRRTLEAEKGDLQRTVAHLQATIHQFKSEQQNNEGKLNERQAQFYQKIEADQGEINNLKLTLREERRMHEEQMYKMRMTLAAEKERNQAEVNNLQATIHQYKAQEFENQGGAASRKINDVTLKSPRSSISSGSSAARKNSDVAQQYRFSPEAERMVDQIIPGHEELGSVSFLKEAYEWKSSEERRKEEDRKWGQLMEGRGGGIHSSPVLFPSENGGGIGCFKIESRGQRNIDVNFFIFKCDYNDQIGVVFPFSLRVMVEIELKNKKKDIHKFHFQVKGYNDNSSHTIPIDREWNQKKRPKIIVSLI